MNLSNWPVLVANSGASIHRSAPQASGSSGANWQSGAATPGTIPFVQLASADFNSDGRVDGADFLTWQRGFGSPNAIREHGNANGDAAADAQDLAMWKISFGATSAAAVAVMAVTAPDSIDAAIELTTARVEIEPTASTEMAGRPPSLPLSFAPNSKAIDADRVHRPVNLSFREALTTMTQNRHRSHTQRHVITPPSYPTLLLSSTIDATDSPFTTIRPPRRVSSAERTWTASCDAAFDEFDAHPFDG